MIVILTTMITNQQLITKMRIVLLIALKKFFHQIFFEFINFFIVKI